MAHEVWPRHRILSEPNEQDSSLLPSYYKIISLGQSLRAVSSPPGFSSPVKGFSSSDTRTIRHGRCFAHGNLSMALPQLIQYSINLARRRDCTSSKVHQTLSRLGLSLPQSLSFRILLLSTQALKRHFHPLRLLRVLLPNRLHLLGALPRALVSRRMLLRRQNLSLCLRSTFLPQVKMASPLPSVRS